VGYVACQLNFIYYADLTLVWAKSTLNTTVSISLDIPWTAVNFLSFLSPPFYGLVDPASASVPALYSIHDLLTKHTPTISVFYLAQTTISASATQQIADALPSQPDQTPITQSKLCGPVSAVASTYSANPPSSSVTIVPSISTSHSEPTSNTPPITTQANKLPPSAPTSSPPSQIQLAASSAQSPEHSTSTSADSASANGSINDDVPGAPLRKKGLRGRKRDSTTALGEPNSKPAKRQKRYVHLHVILSRLLIYDLVMSSQRQLTVRTRKGRLASVFVRHNS
jgi:hypothetical protein